MNILVLILLIIIAVILTTKHVNIVLVISILVNVAVLASVYRQERLENAPTTLDTKQPDDNVVLDDSADAADEIKYDEDTMYGPYYSQWSSYRSEDMYYPSPKVVGQCGEVNSGIDARNIAIAQARARDKRCMDGLVSKDASYYRYHYGDELDLVERKHWWGNNEY